MKFEFDYTERVVGGDPQFIDDGRRISLLVVDKEKSHGPYTVCKRVAYDTSRISNMLATDGGNVDA